MNEKEKLIELIQNAVNGCARNWAEVIAEHLLANGVIVPPCKVGDTVYSYCEVFGVILPYFVETLNIGYIDKNKVLAQYEANCTNDEESELIDSIDFEFEDFGKTVFLTREEAERAIEKVKK